MALDKEDMETITKAVTDSIDNSARAFFIDREKHYRHHDFIESAIGFFNFASKTAWKTFIAGGVLFIMSIMGLGLYAYFKLKGG